MLETEKEPFEYDETTYWMEMTKALKKEEYDYKKDLNHKEKTMIQNHDYDIAVCGGGFGGISAALAAARGGKRVILFEKEYMLGGLGTAGLVTIYLPLCDGMGHQVSFGIAEELFRLSITYGAEARYPENWLDKVGTRTEKDKRYEVQYNAQLFAILAEKLLLENNVDIMYGSYVVDVDIENDRISFMDAGAEVAYLSDRRLVVLDGHFLSSLRVGSFAWLPRENGNLSLVKVG